MKILKIFGIVVGIHVFALVLIFANPGCSTSTKPTPAPSDTVAQTAQPPVSVPNLTPGVSSPTAPAPSSPPVSFNPDAPAVAAAPSDSRRFVPTRPGTPVAGALVAEPVADVTPATTHVVKSGDSLWSVAKKNHLTVAELSAANNLASNATLRPGQKLLIPGKPASPAAAATATGGAGPTPKATETTPPASPSATAGAAARGAGDPLKHTVKTGESLSKIASFYGVKTSEIAVANNIADPAKIKAGDQLIIPGFQTPVSKSGKAGKSGATKAGASKAGEPMEQPAPAPSTPPPVPVIDLNNPPPITPAPRP